MSHKFYFTNWIPDLGRYAIITTALQVKDSRDYAAEAFVFAIDGDLFFDGKRLTYEYNSTTEKWYPVDEDLMHKEALGQAECIIRLKKAEAYRRSKKIDIYRTKLEPNECEAKFVFLGELRREYEVKLEELSRESWAEDLRELISAFLAIIIKVEPL